MSFVDKFVAEVLSIEVTLYHAHARMEVRTDSEALHDLRIAVRRIRSLLRPLRFREETIALNEAAADVGKLTTPCRDLEVLIEELDVHGLKKQADDRRRILHTSYIEIYNSPIIKKLFTSLDEWPSGFRVAERNGDLVNIEKQIEKALSKQVDRLHAGLLDSQFDRHELRILAKRTRYLTAAFPKLSPLSKSATASLKDVQSALGSWHDHFQWCLKVKAEMDLRPLDKVWHDAAIAALENAEAQLGQLASLLPKISGKKKLPNAAAQ
ncbi:MAG: CHAD domain-containing protein [Pseudomonas sp.]